jgi:hypothetical protein
MLHQIWCRDLQLGTPIFKHIHRTSIFINLGYVHVCSCWFIYCLIHELPSTFFNAENKWCVDYSLILFCWWWWLWANSGITFLFGGLGSVVGIATAYGLDGPGIESQWVARFSAPVQTGPEAHPASCTMGAQSFPGVRCGQGVTLTPHPLLVPRSKID